MQKKIKKEGPLYPGTPQAGPVQDHTEPGGSTEVHADAGLNQVRDILLGPMSQTFEQKLNQLEQSIERSMRDLSGKTSVHIEELQKRTDDKLVQMNEDMKEDRERHSKAADKFKQECDTAMNQVRARVERFVKQCETSQAEFAEATRAKMEQLSVTLTGRLETEVGLLRAELVDRASLSSALSEAALRLSGAVHDMPTDSNAAGPEIDAALANLK